MESTSPGRDNGTWLAPISEMASSCEDVKVGKASYSSKGPKRKQPESAVTFPPELAAKQRRARRKTPELQGAGWSKAKLKATARVEQAGCGAGGMWPPTVEHGEQEEDGGDQLLADAPLGRQCADSCGSGKEENVKTICEHFFFFSTCLQMAFHHLLDDCCFFRRRFYSVRLSFFPLSDAFLTELLSTRYQLMFRNLT
jgi:hypothetical protein